MLNYRRSAAAAVLLLLCVAACGGGGNDESDPEANSTPTTAEPTTAEPTTAEPTPTEEPTQEPIEEPPPPPTEEEATADPALLDDLDGVWSTTGVPGTGALLEFKADQVGDAVTYIPADTTHYMLCGGDLEEGDTMVLDCPQIDATQLPITLQAGLALSGTTLTVTWDGGEVETYTYYGPGRS